MTVKITTQHHTYLIEDPEELSIEAPEGLTFEASNDGDNQFYVFKTETEESR
jgi:hypothetical protein